MKTMVKYQGPGKLCLLMLLALCVAGGCTRNYFRTHADMETYAILQEKERDPRWRLGDFSVYPDPRARFADFTRWDRPPTPFDDRYCKDQTPRPQRIKREDYMEGSGWKDFLEESDKTNRKADADRKALVKARKDEIEAERKEMEKRLGISSQERLIGPSGPFVPLIDPSQAYEYKNELARPVTEKGMTPETRAASEIDRPANFVDVQLARKQQAVHAYMLGYNQAVELALFNSREYQTKKEQLYQIALGLTQERFSFAAQFFALETMAVSQAGDNVTTNNAAGGGPQSWAPSTTGGFSKLFSTGALLLAQFANTTAVNLGSLASGNPRLISQSAINFDVVQPFLRGGGRAVTLEPLTQTERNVVYAVRDFAKYRQEFYAYITVGQAAFIAGEQAGVNVFTGGTVDAPSAYVPNSTPVTTGIASPAATAAPQVQPGSSGLLGVNNPVGASAYGYMNTLQQKAQLYTYIKNVAAFEYYFKLLKKYEEGGIVNPVQGYTMEQNLVKGVETMLTNWDQYRQSLDLFRIQLGLPTTLPMELDDEPIQPMYDLIERFEENSIFYSQAIAATGALGKFDEVDKARDRFKKLLTDSPLVNTFFYKDPNTKIWHTLAVGEGIKDGKVIQPFREMVLVKWDSWKAPDDKLEARLKEEELKLNKLFLRKRALEDKRETVPESLKDQIEEKQFDIHLGKFERSLRNYERRGKANDWKEADPKLTPQDVQAAAFLALQRRFWLLLSVPVKLRNRMILESSWPDLPPCYIGDFNLLSGDDEETMNIVVRTALENRLDLMNQKAQLVDSWRKLAVAANALQGFFNVEYNLNATTPSTGSNPFAFSAANTQHQIIFNGSLPIVRVVERNNYRSTLIAYQQQRRQWQDALDQIAYQVRFQVRNLRVQAYNYHRVQKRQLPLAFLVVDQSLQAFNQPQLPTGPSGLTNIGAPTPPTLTQDPAALTLQLLNAQNSLVASQNDLYAQWLQYLISRISLYRDMGVMPIDSKGVWIERVAEKGGWNDSWPEYPPQAQSGDYCGRHLDDQTRDSAFSQGTGGQSGGDPATQWPGSVPGRLPALLPPAELEEVR